MTETVPHYTTPRCRQEGGDHYLNMGIQPWDAMKCWLSPEQFTGYLLGNAITYLARAPTEGVQGKGGRQDVAKAHHCLEKLLEHYQNDQ